MKPVCVVVSGRVVGAKVCVVMSGRVAGAISNPTRLLTRNVGFEMAPATRPDITTIPTTLMLTGFCGLPKEPGAI